MALLCLAEEVRFELTVLAYTRFPSVRLKPLGHPSMKKVKKLLSSAYLSRENKLRNQKLKESAKNIMGMWTFFYYVVP